MTRRILIDGKPSRVVPVERLDLLEGVILQHAVGQTPETFEALRKVAQDIHRRAAPDLYGDAEIASDPALTEAVVEMREALAACEAHLSGGKPATSYDRRTAQDLATRARVALARITVETSDW